jgi:methionyl-tRNA formyltransferase
MRILYATNNLAKVPISLKHWCDQESHTLLISHNLKELTLATKNFDENDVLIADRLPVILPGFWLEQTKFLSVNLHPALLPRHKGSYSLFWSAILDHQCGVTVHELTHELDSGDIFLQKKLNVNHRKTFKELYADIRLLTEVSILTFLGEFCEGRNKKTKQEKSPTPVHTKKSTLPLLAKLPLRWDTRIQDAKEMLEIELSALDWVNSLRN